MGEEITSLCWDGGVALVGGGRGTLQLWNLLAGSRLWAEKARVNI